MNGEQQNLVLSTSGGFWACAYSLYMRIALDYPGIMDYSGTNLPESYQMDFFWRDTFAISTNLGFALELLLKLLLYRDSGKVSKTHLLGRVYAGMSPEIKKVMANVYRDTLKVDETDIGGKEYNKHARDRLRAGRGTSGKIPVVGVKNRDAKEVQAAVMDEVDAETIGTFISERVGEGATVYTDGSRVYDGLWADGFDHEIVYHSYGEYVRGDVHTNGIEAFWSMIKRSIVGVYHKVSRKHLGRYVAEFVARQNMRAKDTIEQMGFMVQKFERKRLRYCDLTS